MSKNEQNPNEVIDKIEENNEDIEVRKDKIKRDAKILIIVLIILLIITTFTVLMWRSLKNVYEGSKKNTIPIEVIQSEILEVKYTEQDFFNLTDDRILSDADGLKTKPLTFNLTNTGSTKVKYYIKLVPLNNDFKVDEVIPSSAIRYKLVESNNESGIKTFSDATNDSLYTGEINSKESLDYKLYIWLDANSNLNLYGKSYLFKLQVEAK